jgi:hypothetical protein
VVDHLGLPEDVQDLGRLDRIRGLADVPTMGTNRSGLYALSREGYPRGSDWPLSTESAPYPDQLAIVGLLPFLDDDARRLIVGEAARVFWWNQAVVSV